MAVWDLDSVLFFVFNSVAFPLIILLCHTTSLGQVEMSPGSTMDLLRFVMVLFFVYIVWREVLWYSGGFPPSSPSGQRPSCVRIFTLESVELIDLN